MLLHPNPRESIREIVEQTVRGIAFRGPLPLPEHLEAYNNIVPDAAERILKMAENNSEHRREMEKRNQEATISFTKATLRIESRNSLMGLIFAFILSIVTIGGGIYAVLQGFQWGGGIISIAGLSSLVGSFIYGSKRLSDKDSNLNSHYSDEQDSA